MKPNPKKATYGNPRNTYSDKYDPVIYDYIWHKAKGKFYISAILVKEWFLPHI